MKDLACLERYFYVENLSETYDGVNYITRYKLKFELKLKLKKVIDQGSRWPVNKVDFLRSKRVQKLNQEYQTETILIRFI